MTYLVAESVQDFMQVLENPKVTSASHERSFAVWDRLAEVFAHRWWNAAVMFAVPETNFRFYLLERKTPRASVVGRHVVEHATRTLAKCFVEVSCQHMLNFWASENGSIRSIQLVFHRIDVPSRVAMDDVR